MIAHDPHPCGVTISRSRPPFGVITDSTAAQALAAQTIVHGVVSLRVRYKSVHANSCASEACRMGQIIQPDTTRVRVTYTDGRRGESFHLACYRYEFIE